jgi:hypothetical protein
MEELSGVTAPARASFRVLAASIERGRRYRDDPARADAPDGPVSGGSSEVMDGSGDDYPPRRRGAQ